MTMTGGDERGGAAFWIAFIIGAGIMAFGIRGAVLQLKGSAPDVAKWVIGADLVHDLVLAPIAVAVGWTVNRVVPARWRTPVQVGLVATGITLLLGWPGWRGYGRHLVPDNPSVQPLDYTTAILTVLAVIWSAVAIWLVVRVVTDRRVPQPASASTPTDSPSERLSL
ncbi:MAG: hypothetical protein ABJC79_07340 [Acidimicrobiia bacterium]